MIGIELRADTARAGGRTFPFDAAAPEKLVEQLRHQFGRVPGIALSIGLAWLWVKHIKLPPAQLDVRRRMLLIEPDRFFPVRDVPIAVALTDDFAFAMDAALLDRWVASFEQWSPVRLIEPAPLSLARAHPDATLSLAAKPDEHGVMTTSGGVLTAIRHAPKSMALPAANPPADDDAASAVTGATPATMLLSDSLERRFTRRAWTKSAMRAGVVVLGIIVLAISIDHARRRTLAKVEEEIARIEPQARPLLAAPTVQLPSSDVLGMMQLLTQRLPRDVVILNLRQSEGSWQIDGTASNAAALVPLLDGARFQDVHMLSPSSRYREGEREYETFAIAFRDH